MADAVVAVVTKAWGGDQGLGAFWASNSGSTAPGGAGGQGGHTTNAGYSQQHGPYKTCSEAQLVCQNAWAGRPLRWVRADIAGIESWEGHLEV